MPDAYEMRLLSLISTAEANAHELLVKARSEYENDKTALNTYVSHMNELSYAHAFMVALTVYREYIADRVKDGA